jgi:hypothetical protein
VPSVAYTLHETQGNPPMPAGGWLVGGPDDSVEDLVDILRRQYGTRLAFIELKDGTRVDLASVEAAVLSSTRVDLASVEAAVLSSTCGAGEAVPVPSTLAVFGDASSSADPAAVAEALLLAQGWQRAGNTEVQIIHSRNTGLPKFDEHGQPLTMGGRPRYRKGHRYASVGPKTCCFYRQTDTGPADLRRIPTKDIAAVRAAAE